MKCRSMTSGFRSIISVWLCKNSKTTSRETPAGSGLIVVNTVLFVMMSGAGGVAVGQKRKRW